jgi:hypothetical protein
VLSRWSSVLRPPQTSHLASPWTSLLQLIPAVTMAVVHRPDETSPVPSPTLCDAVHRQHPAPPTPEGPSRLHSRFLTASMAFAFADKHGSLWFPFRANISTLPCNAQHCH